MLPGILGFLFASFIPLFWVEPQFELLRLAGCCMLLLAVALYVVARCRLHAACVFVSQICFVLGLAIGLFNAVSAMQASQQHLLAEEGDGQDYWLTARVSTLPEMRRSLFGDYHRVVVDVLALQPLDEALILDFTPRRVRINLYEPLPVAMGDVWRCLGGV